MIEEGHFIYLGGSVRITSAGRGGEARRGGGKKKKATITQRIGKELGRWAEGGAS